jgi:membrane-associated phospholipid phosphatase
VLGGHPALTEAPAQRGASSGTPLEAVDRLILAYLAGLAGLTIVYCPRPWQLLAPIAAVAVALVATARLHPHSRLGRWAHDFFPIAGVLATFNLSGPVIAVTNPARWDAALTTWDRALFGALPALWIGMLGRPAWFTDAASIVYCSYYVIPVAMGVALYRADRLAEFDEMVFAVVATFLVSFVCYLAAPALGPRVPADQAAFVLGGGPASEAVRWFLLTFEGNELDAFPSGHTALSLIFLAFGWRFFPRWRAPLVLLVAGIVFSTVYLSLHYIVDVLAGVLLACAMPLLLPLLRRLAAPSLVSGRR